MEIQSKLLDKGVVFTSSKANLDNPGPGLITSKMFLLKVKLHGLSYLHDLRALLEGLQQTR